MFGDSFSGIIPSISTSGYVIFPHSPNLGAYDNQINLDFGSGNVNPRNLTQGAFNFVVRYKKYPKILAV